MWSRRILYLLALIGAYIYFLLHRMWVSWYILLLVITIPIVSLILCIISLRKFNPKATIPSVISHGTEGNISIADSKDETLFMYDYVSFFRVHDYMEDTDTLVSYSSGGRRDYSVVLEGKHCGAFCFVFEYIKFYDLLGLFCFKRKIGEEFDVKIMPVASEPDNIPKLNNIKARGLKKSGSPYSEIYDIRDYVEGDSTKNIHWKMTAKRDTVLVREPLEEDLENARIILELKANRDENDKMLNEMMFISNFFISKGISHRIRVVPPIHGDVSFDIQEEIDVTKMINEVLYMRLPRRVNNG